MVYIILKIKFNIFNVFIMHIFKLRLFIYNDYYTYPWKGGGGGVKR